LPERSTENDFRERPAGRLSCAASANAPPDDHHPLPLRARCNGRNTVSRLIEHNLHYNTPLEQSLLLNVRLKETPRPPDNNLAECTTSALGERNLLSLRHKTCKPAFINNNSVSCARRRCSCWNRLKDQRPVVAGVIPWRRKSGWLAEAARTFSTSSTQHRY